jgi:uncharacterized protein YwqG
VPRPIKATRPVVRSHVHLLTWREPPWRLRAYNRLLLQLAYDDMMFWGFGDNGVYQFWIKRDDLAARNWDAVKLTFECH